MAGLSPGMKARRGKFIIEVGTDTPPADAALKTITAGISDDGWGAGYRSLKTTLDSYGSIDDDQYDGNTIFYFHVKTNGVNPNQVRFLLQKNGITVLPYASINVTVATTGSPATSGQYLFAANPVDSNLVSPPESGSAPYTGYYLSTDMNLVNALVAVGNGGTFTVTFDGI